MDAFGKQVLIIVFSVLVGVALVVSGVTGIIHDYSSQYLKQVIDKENSEETEKLTESLGYSVELILASLLLVSPLCGISGVWFAKIAYELLVGNNAHVNVFILHPFLNVVFALMCLVLFGYCMYSQYQWAVRLTQPRLKTTNDKDLTRLI
jgi:hypothetical protein